MKKEDKIYKINYDEFTDTLYISQNKPVKAMSYMDENFIIVRKKDNSVCGITIDSFKGRHEDKSWNDNFILSYFPSFNLRLLSALQ